MRRGVAATAAVVLVAEALGIALIHWILGSVVERQQMSLAGLDYRAMADGTFVTGGVFAVFLVCCAVVAGRMAIRDRAPGRFGRILFIVGAVVHAVLGALVVGMVGWSAFVLMMVVLALLVGTLLAYGPGTPASGPGDDDPQASGEAPPGPPAAPAAA